jgi:hypothetical protein
MATPPPVDNTDLDALIAKLAAGGGGATSGKFTWTPPPGGAAYAGMAGSLFAGPAVPGRTRVAGLPETVDAVGFGARLSQLDPSQVEALQRQLYESGAYPDSYYGKNPKKIAWGQRDPDTVGILQQMAGLASFTGNLDQILGAKVDVGALAAKERAPLVIELPSQEDMTSVLKDTAADILGRDPTPQELARYSASFTARVKAYQGQRYAAGEAGGTVTQAPQAQAMAESFLQEQSPVEAGAQRMEKGLAALRQVFTGGGGGG